MTTAKTRTDIHRPALLDPADYTYLGCFYQGASDEMQKAYGYEHTELMRAREVVFADGGTEFEGNYAAKLTCDHCGASFAHGVVFLHVPTNEMVTVGHICAENTVGLPSRAAKARRAAEKAQVEATKRQKQLAATAPWREANPDIVEFLDLVRQAEADYRDAMEAANEQFEVAYQDAYKAGTKLPRFKAPKAPATSHPFLTDMVHTVNRYGKLSDAQAAATRKFIASAKERAENPPPVEAEPEQPLAEGRYEFAGEIVSHRWQESDYGSTHKALVKLDDGNKVWGTIPTSVEDALTTQDPETYEHTYEDPKGHRVSLTATVTRSDDDEHFGFYKRPTGAKLLTPTNKKED